MTPPLTRRDFLSRAAALIGAAGTAACGRPVTRPIRTDIPPTARFGVQLYSLRDLMQRDAAGTMAAVAAAGFDEVEFAGFYGHTAAQMRELIDRNKLTSPAGHVSIDDLRAQLPQLLVDADVLGWRWLIVPWIDQRERTAAGYHAIAADLNRAGAIAADNGVGIGYHAEDYDFRPLQDGTIPYDILLSEGRCAMELDTYWIAKGGGDPLKYLSRHRGRFPLLHIKDITADGKMANAGEGIIDFPAIIAAARRQGAAHFIIENDEPRNPIADVTRGLKYLKRIIRS